MGQYGPMCPYSQSSALGRPIRSEVPGPMFEIVYVSESLFITFLEFVKDCFRYSLFTLCFHICSQVLPLRQFAITISQFAITFPEFVKGNCSLIVVYIMFLHMFEIVYAFESLFNTFLELVKDHFPFFTTRCLHCVF